MVDSKRLSVFALATLGCAAALGAYAAAPLPPSNLCVDDSCVTVPSSPSNSNGIKWHPGHYVTLDPVLRRDNLSKSKAAHFATIKTICNLPEWQGVQIFGTWAVFEGDTAGDYSSGIAMVKEYLDELRPCGKRLMIGIWKGSFSGTSASASYLPAYIINDSKYGYTVFKYGSGYTSRVWQQETADRIIARNNAYGAAFDEEPLLEMFSAGGETAISVNTGTNGYSSSALFTQTKRVIAAARKAWPTTQIRLNANFTTEGISQMPEWLAYCREQDCAVGGPDTIPGNDIWGSQVFTGDHGGVNYRGVLPWVGEVQPPEMEGKEGTNTPAELFNHMRNGQSCSPNTCGSHNPNGTILPVYPQYVVWWQFTWNTNESVGWTAVRKYVEDTLNGQVTDGVSSKLVAPSSVPCPSALTCNR